ncbi:MAG: flavin reductase [Rhizobiales bacterium]|nr:flavin reductase [Hyphomicrobiales bacterium]MBI3674061.1 flavin reductase [Hyphomicrobiales bacterium]
MEGIVRPGESAENFIAAMGLAATGVSVITTEGEAGRLGRTVSAISSVSADPPLILACVNRKSPAVAAPDANGVFAVNLLSAHNQPYAETFSGKPREGTPFDFANHDWETGRTGLPIVTDATAVFECTLEASYDAGSHRIFIGRVLAAHRGSAERLVYCSRAFRRITNH